MFAKILFILIVVAPAPDAVAWSLFGYDNYADCVLQETKTATTDRGAINVLVACRKKFPMNYQECINEAKNSGKLFYEIDCEDKPGAPPKKTRAEWCNDKTENTFKRCLML
jgi:hypothetical protein